MDSQIISVAYSTYVNKGAFALLLGSGISRNSGIPTGWEITLKLIDQLATLENNEALPDLAQWYKNEYGQEADYSDILERLTNTKEERLNLLRRFIEPNTEELEEGLKTPTKAHRQIARLVRDGYIKVIVTTNFDRLLENALKEIGVEPTVISNPNHVDNSIPLVHSRITIIKINGDYLDTTLLNIKNELINYDPRSIDLLRFVFENFGLITCGWSAKWDIGLVDIIKSASKFRYSTYFTYLYPDPELNDLNSFRGGQLVKIAGADEFFTELSEGIEALEKNDTVHPLTTAIVLQRLKKYLVKEEHIISLHDLFHNSVQGFIPKLQSPNFKNRPDTDLMRDVISTYTTGLDVLLVLMINGSYWAREYHYVVITKTLKEICLTADGTDTGTGGWGDWRHIVLMPALILRYACGIASIAGKKFNLLYQITFLEVKTEHKKDLLLRLTSPDEVIESSLMNAVNGNNLLLPINEFIFKLLRPYFKELIPTDSEFDYVFNYYEFLSSMIHHQRDEYQWAPLGRFHYWHSRSISIQDDLTERSKKEGTSFELIKAGFSNDTQEFDSAMGSFKAFYDTVRRR